jgi:hypothetical protein
LVCVRIAVEPRLLEGLLDMLARLSFPINPQLYHDASAVSVGPDGSRHTEPATVVEFPAWTLRVPELRKALDRSGLPGVRLELRDMLDDIHSLSSEEAAGPEAPGKAVLRPGRPLRATA